jgi:recombinational DNA repair protein (RecF pathway)
MGVVLKKCISCGTTVHVGVAKSVNKETYLCLQCSVKPKYREYNIWSVIEKQRMKIK